MFFPRKRKKSFNKDEDSIQALANEKLPIIGYENFEKELIAINKNELSQKEIESWYHLFGICAFQQKNHDLAKERFNEGLQRIPNSSDIKFSLAQEYIFLGNSDKAFQLFDECIFPEIPRDFALAESRYAYLFSEYEKGISYVLDFFRLYKEVKILDDHFLYIRGLPFLSTA